MQMLLKLVFSVLLAISYAEEPQPKMSWAEALSGWENTGCRDNGTFNFCVLMLGILTEVASGGKDVLVHRSQLSDDWRPVMNEAGLEVLQDADFLIVKESEVRARRLIDLIFRSSRESNLENRKPEKLVEAVARLPQAPAIDFEKLRRKIIALYSDFEGEDRKALDFHIRWLQRFDPYTYITVGMPEMKEDTESKLTFNFTLVDDIARFMSIAPGSGLDRAGVATGDRLVAIDDTEMLPSNVYDFLKSDAKYETMTVESAVGRRELKIDKSFSNDPSLVKGYMVPVNGKKIGVISISTFFNHEICSRVRERILEFKAQDVDTLVYDLRGNPGGFTHGAVCVLGLSLGPNVPIYKEVLLPNSLVYKDAKAVFPEITTIKTEDDRVVSAPLTLLVNSFSQSAAEILTSVLKLRELAWVVGRRTYGKGIGQKPQNTKWDGVFIFHTVFRMEMMDGSSYHALGISPDFPVSFPIAGVDGEKFSWRIADEYGYKFVGKPLPPLSRARRQAKARVDSCLRDLHLQTDANGERWLNDQELRKAVSVSYCDLVTHARAGH